LRPPRNKLATPLKKMLFRILERVFVFVLLLSSMTVVDALSRPTYSSGHDPDILSTDVPLPTVIMESGVYACGAFLVLGRWRRVARAARRVWPLVALTLLAPISLMWSNAPGLTARRSIFLLGSTLLGIYLGEKFSIEQLLRWLAQVLCVLIAASILLYFIFPSFVVDYTAYDGAWKGITVNKNTFGWCMNLAVTALVLVRFRHFRWLRYVFLLLAAVLLLLSRSATSLVGCVLMTSMIPLWRVVRAGAKTRRLVYVLTFAAISTGIYLIWAEQELLFRVLGRDPTFTGRTALWNLLIPAIAKHPIAGYGYGAFWSGTNNELLNIDISSRWLPMGAHNGYLELCLAFGIVGLPLLIYVMWCSFRMATDYVKSNEGWFSVWPMTYLLLFVFHNCFESHLLMTRSLEFLLFVAITTSMSVEHYCTQPRTRPSHPYALVDHKHPSYSGMAP
jgi:exopolysaccharide production protein ExoQ